MSQRVYIINENGQLTEAPDIGPNQTGIRIGYDPPLQTYFAICLTEQANPEQDDPKIHLWVGTSMRQCSVEEMAAKVASFHVLPQEIIDQVRKDGEAEGALSTTQPYRPVPFVIVNGTSYYRCLCGGTISVIVRQDITGRQFHVCTCERCDLLGPVSFVGPNDAERLFETTSIVDCDRCGREGCDDCNGAGRVCLMPNSEESE